MFTRIRYKLEDWKMFYPVRFWSGLALIIIGIGFFLYLNMRVPVGFDKEGNPKENSNEQIEQLTKDSEKLKETFSTLNEVNINSGEKYPVLNISLYLKDPFITQTDLLTAINLYINTLKVKYNDSSKGEYIRAIQFKIYDRKLVYDKELAPRATIYYMEDKLDVLKQAEKDKDENANNLADTNNFVWQKTIEKTNKPKYDKYTVVMDDFMQYTKNSNPLSDEEFAFFLKLKLYSAVAGSDIAGIRTYLKWDLGAKLGQDGEGLIVDELNNFLKREYDTGDKINYYDNVDILKQKMAVQRPQFLLFALKNQLVNDRLEAQKELIALDSKLYQTVIEKDATDRANAINKDGTSSYEESTEFDATVGVMKEEEKKESTGTGLRKRTISVSDDDSSNADSSTESTE